MVMLIWHRRLLMDASIEFLIRLLNDLSSWSRSPRMVMAFSPHAFVIAILTPTLLRNTSTALVSIYITSTSFSWVSGILAISDNSDEMSERLSFCSMHDSMNLQ